MGCDSPTKSTSFIHVFKYVFSYAGTSKENGLVVITVAFLHVNLNLLTKLEYLTIIYLLVNK
jgi:hypothetical protein